VQKDSSVRRTLLDNQLLQRGEVFVNKSSLNKRWRTLKEQPKMDNPEKLAMATHGTQEKDKKNKNTTHNVLETVLLCCYNKRDTLTILVRVSLVFELSMQILANLCRFISLLPLFNYKRDDTHQRWRTLKEQPKMDNPEKLAMATHGTQEKDKKNKNTTHNVLETTIYKQSQITLIRHD
jgi:hypothetical protein